MKEKVENHKEAAVLIKSDKKHTKDEIIERVKEYAKSLLHKKTNRCWKNMLIIRIFRFNF